MQTLAKAGELSLRLPRDAQRDKLGRAPLAPAAPAADRAPSRALAIVARNDPGSAAFVEKFMVKHCKTDVSQEWTRVDDGKLDALRGILAALKEENQSSQLLKQESADRQAGQRLEATRAGVKQRLQACEAQEAVFDKKKVELQRHVMDNEKTLRLMETNIEKGERKSKEEANECKRLDHDIKQVLASIEEHEEGRSAEEKQIARALEHKSFLEMVVQECEEDFEGDIKVLMNRYHTLDAERQSLHKRNTELAEQLNKVREELLKVQAELQTEQMMDSSRLHEAQVELERRRAENKDLEQNLNRMLEERELKKSQAGIILMAIDQIFTRVVQSCRLKQRKDAMLAEVEDQKFVPIRSDRERVRLEAQLNQIIARVRDLRDMSEKVRAQVEKEKKPVVTGVLDDVDILSKVQFVQHRERQGGPAFEANLSATSGGTSGATGGGEGGLAGSQGSANSAGPAKGRGLPTRSQSLRRNSLEPPPEKASATPEGAA